MAGPEGGGGGALISLFPLFLIFLIFYFLLILPQQKRQKAHQRMLEALKKGDRVVTGGGLLGTITKVKTHWVELEIAEKVRVKVEKSSITRILEEE